MEKHYLFDKRYQRTGAAVIDFISKATVETYLWRRVCSYIFYLRYVEIFSDFLLVKPETRIFLKA